MSTASLAATPALPGRPPPPMLWTSTDSELDLLSARLRLLERPYLAIDLSGDDEGPAPAVRSLNARVVQNSDPHVQNPGTSRASGRDVSSPANDIIRIFHHARPDVQLVPVTYPLAPAPAPRPYRPNFLLPSQLRAMAACALQRPVYTFKVSSSTEDSSSTERWPPIGHAAPAA